MFFPKKITSIRSWDKVLEVGPGGTPHPRSDVFLELTYDSESDRLSQRGHVEQEPCFDGRPVHFYDGGKFPFNDREFDYVICSHVIEHVTDPVSFLAEVFRVGGGRGYLEYPLITYEYLYDFDVHLHFVKWDSEVNVLRYCPKRDSSLTAFSAVCTLFRKSLSEGWNELCSTNKQLFFEGVEFSYPFVVEKTDQLDKLLPEPSVITRKSSIRRRIGQLLELAGF